MPSEVDVRTTSKWFWTSSEKAKSAEKLFQIYLESVGRNATPIMNCAPNTDGVMPENVCTSLRGLGELLTARLSVDMALNKTVTAEQTRNPGNFAASNMTDGDKTTYWATNDDQITGTFVIDLGEVKTIHYVTLQEYIALGQRVKGFSIETSSDNSSWDPFATGTTIGYKRIMAKNDDTTSYGNGTQARYIRVKITDSKACPLISTVSVY